MKVSFAPRRVLGEVVLWSAFLASGGHVFQVARDMGNSSPIALVHAIGLDGLVYVGINACRDGAWVRGIISVVYGGAMSLAFNWASYSPTGRLDPVLIAMSMPVTLILSVIAGHAGSVGKKPVTSEKNEESAEVPAQEQPQEPPAPRQEPPAVPAPAAPVVVRDPAPAPRKLPRASAPRPVAKGRTPEARAAAAADVLAGRKKAAEVAAELGVSTRAIQNWVSEHRDKAAAAAEPIQLPEVTPLPAPTVNGHDFSQVKAGEN